MDELKVEIKGCPFCGSEKQSVAYIRDGKKVLCSSCGASGASTFHGHNHDTDERAIASWNNRAQPTPVTGTELPPLSGHARYGRRASKAVSSRKFHFIEPAIKALFEREDQLLSCMAERDAALDRIRPLESAAREAFIVMAGKEGCNAPFNAERWSSAVDGLDAAIRTYTAAEGERRS